MKKYNFAALIAAALLTLTSDFSTAHEVVEAPVPLAETPAPSRIRIFVQNGKGALLFKGSACAGNYLSGNGEDVRGGMMGAFASFFKSVENTSLGMPETPNSLNLASMDGFASKAFFKEYELPVEKPTSLRMSFSDAPIVYSNNGAMHSRSGPSCSGAIRFVPHAGEDYEAGFAMVDKICLLSIKRVLVTEGKTEMVPVAVERAPDC